MFDHMCFEDLEKAYNRVLWGVLWEYEVSGPLLQAICSLYNQSKSCFCIPQGKTRL